MPSSRQTQAPLTVKRSWQRAYLSSPAPEMLRQRHQLLLQAARAPMNRTDPIGLQMISGKSSRREPSSSPGLAGLGPLSHQITECAPQMRT